MIAESVARLLEVRRQAEEERIRYADQARLRGFEIERLHRIVQAADKNAYESQHRERVATVKLARAQAQPVGAASRVATPPAAYAGSPRQSQNASPSKQANLRPPTNPEGGNQGYDRMEDLMREECAAVEGCTSPKQRRYADEVGTIAGSLRGSPMIAAQPPGTIR